MTAEKSYLAKTVDDYPFFVSDPIYIFPFHHSELWADIPTNVLATYCDTLDRVCVQLAQSELAKVRNGIDHKREDDDFPKPDTMLACVTRLLEALDIADSTRLIPKLYWGQSMLSDAAGNVCSTFADYRNVIVSLWEPSPMALNISKPLEVPHLLAPFDLLDMPNSNLAFFVSPRTTYSEYWENYPRR